MQRLVPSFSRGFVSATAAVIATAGLVACTDSGENADQAAASSPASESSAPQETTSAVESSTDTSATSEPESTSGKPTKENGELDIDALPESVAEVAKVFRGTVDDEIFMEFESCNDRGVDSARECTGPEIGQFQFFNSDSKATSSAQILTELRSSRVVEESDDRLVGWSSLGTTAVLTVVDTAQGLVVQKMVSTDADDPEEQLATFGMIKGDNDNGGSDSSPESEPTPTSAQR